MIMTLIKWAAQKRFHNNFHGDPGWSNYVKMWESRSEREKRFQWNKKRQEKNAFKKMSAFYCGNLCLGQN